MSDPYYDIDINVHVVYPIKFSEIVDSSVFFSPLYFFPHQGLSTGGEWRGHWHSLGLIWVYFLTHQHSLKSGFVTCKCYWSLSTVGNHYMWPYCYKSFPCISSSYWRDFWQHFVSCWLEYISSTIFLQDGLPIIFNSVLL